MSASIKPRRSNPPARLTAGICALLLLLCHTPAAALPVFIADNHAETFGWITRTFDPDEAYTLALIDAHSDASAAERSEEIREQIRRVPTLAARATIVEKWRAEHRLQAFNWIEPLMPRPLDQIHWFSPATSGTPEQLQAEAVSALDGRLEVEPRSSGSLSQRWYTHALGDFPTWPPGARPVILAVDLDTFAGMDARTAEEAFYGIWKRAMELPSLRGVAFAISRPWLESDEQAARLITLALRAVRHTRGATLEWDASVDDRPDDSLNATRLRQNALPIPRWDLAAALQPLTAQLGAMDGSPHITDRKRSWKDGAFPPPAEIRPTKREIDLDGVWRFPAGEEPLLRLDPIGTATGRVRWYLLRSAAAAYDLIPATGLGKGFSQATARRIYEEHSNLGETEDFLLEPSVWRSAAGGSVRITAEYETPSGWMPAATVEIRIRTADGFRGALSECMGMPYVFGIAGVARHDLTGVETGWGSDCANLLIYAWRRNGIPLAWGDPGRLRRQLEVRAAAITTTTGTPVSQEEIHRGVAIDFGQHAAAIWEDRPPLGIVDGGDLVMHHLGGRPEIVTLGTLATTRPVFSLLVPPPMDGLTIAFAGDVVLADANLSIIPDFKNHAASLLFANLEGIPSLFDPIIKPRYDFRFPPERIEWLKEHRITAVSLANNHALDAGTAGLLEGLHALREKAIPFAGAGANAQEACAPCLVEAGGTRIALFGISIVGGGAAGPATPGIAMLPQHADILEQNLRQARRDGARIVVMLHGGDEYAAKVNDDQRRWARWLIARGATIISGAHPHVIQREEFHGGALVLHSLGNAFYPTRLKGADSGKIRTVTLPHTPR